jgi:hypothetical protein
MQAPGECPAGWARPDMVRPHERFLDAVIAGGQPRAWKQRDHYFTLNRRIARRIERKTSAAAFSTS